MRVHILVAFIVTIAPYNKKKKYMVAEHFDMLPNDFLKIADRTMIVNAHSISKLIIDYTSSCTYKATKFNRNQSMIVQIFGGKNEDPSP